MAAHLMINPIDDDDFVRDTHAAASGVSDPAVLERALQAAYPNVRVHHGVAEADGSERWYVYRDGRWKDIGT